MNVPKKNYNDFSTSTYIIKTFIHVSKAPTHTYEEITIFT